MAYVLGWWLIPIGSVHAVTYYVAPDGNDNHSRTQAQSNATPWRTLNHAAGQVADGDTVLVGGGVYCEEVVMQSDGVTWQAIAGQTPIIDGSVELQNPVPVLDANDFLDPTGLPIAGRFAGNPDWTNICKVTFPPSDTSLPTSSIYRTMILEDGQLLGASSLPEQINNLYDNYLTYFPIDSQCYGNTTTVIGTGHTEPNDYWNGAILKIYRSADSSIIVGRVADWTHATQTFRLEAELAVPLASGDRYKLENHWGCLTRPGEIYVPAAVVDGYYTAYLWPNDPNGSLRIAKYDTGWNMADGADDNLIIDGFTIRNFCGTVNELAFGLGRAFEGSTAMENTIIRNCSLQNISGKYGIILANARNCIIDNCTLSDVRVGWGIFNRNFTTEATRGRDVLIQNCRVDWCQGTSYKIIQCDYAQIRNCFIGRSGTHGNGIAIYEGNNHVGIFHNQAINATVALAYQDVQNLYVIGNDFQTLWASASHWADTTAGNMVFLHNTMALSPEVDDLRYGSGFQLWGSDDPATPADYIIKNNIFWSTNKTIPPDYTTPPNTFVNAHNCFLQTTEHWPEGSGSFESPEPENLFRGWSQAGVRDLAVKDENADIYQAGVNVDAVISSIEDLFATRGQPFACDLHVDRFGTPWASTPSVGAYEYRTGGNVYNISQHRYYSTIQQAIQNAAYGDEIVVSPGTYAERIDFLGKTVRLRSLQPYDRAVVEATIIDAGQAGRAVTFHSGEDANSLLAGFTITGGFLDDEHTHGAGISCNTGSPRIENCRVRNNYTTGYGGGLYAANASVTVERCDFIDNEACRGGGGLMNDANTMVSISDCAFIANTTCLAGAGLLNDTNSLSKVTNCLFSGNVAGIDGGAVYNDANSLTMLTNCTLSGNAASRYGGGLVNIRTDPNISNCILWANTALLGDKEIYNDDRASPLIRCCDIQGSFSGGRWNPAFGADAGGNIDADPLFADAAGADQIPGTWDDDLRLLAGSPCIDAAENVQLSGITADLAGRLRFVDHWPTPDTGVGDAPVLDMGAYEYACTGNLDASADVTLADFALLAQSMMMDNCSFCNGADLNGDAHVTIDDLHILMAHWLCGKHP